MRKNSLSIFIFVIFTALIGFGGYFVVFAQTADEVAAEQSQLQDELKQIEAQIAQYQSDLKNIQGEKNTLQNKINQLKKQQTTLTLQIKATGLQVEDLETQISQTQVEIDSNQAQIEKLNKQMAEILRAIYRYQAEPLMIRLFNAPDISAVLAEEKDYAQISRGLSDLLAQGKSFSQQLNFNEQLLEIQQGDTKNLLSIQTLQQQAVLDSVYQQNTLLKETKGEESNYQAALNDTKKRAQAIRTRLYQLLDVQKQIDFGEAVSIANWASAQTGVRPAFLLSVLTQESNLGKNVGTCNRTNDPPSKSYKVVMHPTRDQPIFLEITSALGRDPDTTPISCPMHDKNGEQIGWGGAMGPAQFIPSTWKGYAAKVSAITGKTADPWDIRDAFLASAIKLAADGATSKDGEWAAAMRYFCGSTNSAYSFYGDNVVARADQYQSDIEDMNK